MTIKQKISNGSRTIPKALREQVWLKHFGRTFEAKCPIDWCSNVINVFDFESAHNIPFSSKGGTTDISNLIPLCSRCNKSMSNNYTIDEWQKLDKNIEMVGKKNNSVVVSKSSRSKPSSIRRGRSWYCCFLC